MHLSEENKIVAGLTTKAANIRQRTNETKENDSEGSHYKRLSFFINKTTQQKEFFLSELGGPTIYKLVPRHYTANINSKTKQ